MDNAIIYSNILISIMEGTIQCAALTDLFASLMYLPNDDDFSCKTFQIIAGTKKSHFVLGAEEQRNAGLVHNPSLP